MIPYQSQGPRVPPSERLCLYVFILPLICIAPAMLPMLPIGASLLLAAMLPITSALLQPTPRSRVQPTRARFAQDGWTTAVTQERGATYACHSVLRVPLDRVQRRSTQLFARLTDWTTRVDETSGATYYYNEETGESQWEPPQAAVAQQDDGGQSASEKPKPLWSFVGSSGTVVNGYRHVDYNLRKHDVQVLSRFNMLQQRLTVSRKQCLVSCYVEPRWLRPRPPGSLEASLSASSRRRLRHAPASLGQSAAWAALAGYTGLVFHTGLLPRGWQRYTHLGGQGSHALAGARRPVVLGTKGRGPRAERRRPGERLQPYALDAATLCARGCSPMCSRLQPHVSGPSHDHM